MKTAILACLGVLACTTVSHSQSPCVPEIIGKFGGLANTIDVVDSIAYVGYTRGDFLIYDISNEMTPQVISALTFSDPINDIQVSNGLAYLANNLGGLIIVDVSTPTAPAVIGQIADRGRACSVDVVNGLAYLANTRWLSIIDVSDPADPQEIGYYFTNTIWLMDVHVSGTVAYLAALESGLLIFDVSDPTTPTLLGALDTPGRAFAVAVADGKAYVAAHSSGIQIIDVTNLAAPTLVAIARPRSGNWYKDLAVRDNIVYAVEHFDTLLMIDVSTPELPVLLGTIGEREWTPHSISLDGNRAYITYGAAGGFLVIDVTDPSVPTQILSNVPPLPTASHGISVVGEVAYIADGSAGLRLVDVSNPYSPSLLSTFETRQHAVDVGVKNNVAYVIEYYVMEIIDVSDPFHPTLIDTFNLSAIGREICIVNSMAYIAKGGRLQILDITIPSAIVDLGTYLTGVGGTYACAVDGNVAYVAVDDMGLQIVDISNPSAPTLLGTYDTPGRARGVSASNGVVCVTDMSEGLHIIDVSDPQLPSLIRTFELPSLSSARNVTISNDIAYAILDLGLWVIDLSNPTAPLMLGENKNVLPFGFDITVSEGIAYIAGHSSGLTILEVSPCQLAPCPADSDGNRNVNVSDLLNLLANWGSCLEPCPPDSDRDGDVDVFDLLQLLSTWGACP